MWQCKNDPEGKLCNKYKPNSNLGYLYWDLVDGYPKEETDFETAFVEPSRDQLIAMINRVPIEPDFNPYLDPIILEMSLE